MRVPKQLYDPHKSPRSEVPRQQGEIDGVRYRLYTVRGWSTKYSLQAVVPWEHPDTGEVHDVEIPVGTVKPNVFSGHPFWIRDAMRRWIENRAHEFPLLDV